MPKLIQTEFYVWVPWQEAEHAFAMSAEPLRVKHLYLNLHA